MSALQLGRLLPLPEEELEQILEYGRTLSKAEAAEHFGNLLGESADAIDFISNFNAQRRDAKATVMAPAASRSRTSTPPVGASTSREPNANLVAKNQGWKKKKQKIHTPVARKTAETGPAPGTAYKKDREEEYIVGKPGTNNETQGTRITRVNTGSQRKQKPLSSSPGRWAGDVSKPKAKDAPQPAWSGPASSSQSKAKVIIAGGTPMHGASTAVADLDAAIRSLEIMTKPTLAADAARRRCDCAATRHPLQSTAPNCLNCGKIICLKEGLGPCTFCGAPIMDSSDVQAILRELRADRGREKMAADRAAHEKADVPRFSASFSRDTRGNPAGGAALSAAEAQRDKLLEFQAQSAKRTTVRDEAADFDYSMASGGAGNIWASPEERARELKRQQKILREMEWNASPEYEKRTPVVSIDVSRGKAVKMMAPVEIPRREDESEDGLDVHMGSVPQEDVPDENKESKPTRAFSKNPLLGDVVKPVYNIKGKGSGQGRKAPWKGWRRAQMDDDNVDIILDGGVYGGTLGPKSTEGALSW